ncbi:MAG: serine/threonine protein kinase [Myxococcales bacterium]|nr:serine/threonine protein kinase [Myxococcales bacterium]
MTTDAHAYQLMEICAAGTFGTVVVVRDLHRGRLVALKVLKEAHLNRPRVIARTRDEAAILSQIHHPNIVAVEGLVEIEERPVVVMEWVRGLSLETVLKHQQDGMPLAEALEVVRQATLALGAAYEAIPPGGNAPMRIIHRDVKPSNMLLSVDGELKVVDFGIARGEFEGKEAKTLSMVLGARGYLAPERLDGHDDKPSCDIYSLGIMAYELLTGRHVVLSVHKDYHAEALDKHLQSLHWPDLPEEALEEIRALVADMCRYDEGRRPDHEQVATRLARIVELGDLKPDLRSWSRRTLLPLFKNRARTRPIDHPAYRDLAFVERAGKKVRSPAPPDVDTEIRRLLRTDDWLQHLDDLDLLLTSNPHWSEQPFLEVLPTGPRAWWQFWGGKELTNDQLVTVLRLLRQRPTQNVRDKVAHLRRHSDPAVASAATEIR